MSSASPASRRAAEVSAARLTRGYVICLIGTIIWSTVAVFIRYLTENYALPPLVLAFWRDMILAASLGVFFLLRSPRRLLLERRHWGFMLLYGLVLSLFNALWTISVALNGAAVSTVLAYSSAAFTALLGWRLWGERLDALKILAVTFSLLGCVFVAGAYDVNAWRLNPVGVFTGLASGLAFAGYSLMGKAAAMRQLYPWSTLAYVFGLAALWLLGYNLLPLNLPAGLASTNLFWLGPSVAGWVVLAVLSLGPTLGGYGLYTVSLTYLPASVANLIATLEPASTALLAYLFLGELFTGPQWLGSFLIIAGVVLLRWSEQRALRERP